MVRMRSFRKMSALCLPLAALLFASQCVLPGLAAAAAVKVQVGTPVDLTFDTAVTGETATVGQQVTFKVATPVTVDGKTVIAAGAPAMGEVVSSKKSGMVGMPGQIGVVAKTVTAVDGTIIPLSGTRALEGKSNVATSVIITVVCCILGLLMKGEKAEIPAGASMRATVASPVDVNVE